MFLLYNLSLTPEGAYAFTTDQGHKYLIYFSETSLVDEDNNQHVVYNLGFLRDDDFSSSSYSNKFDSKIKATIIHVVNDFFEKNDHKCLLYFCYGEDGFSRNRKIVFNQWGKYLNNNIEKYDSTIVYDNIPVYGSLMIVKDNPLKSLILSSFAKMLNELK